jgi:uncharacterized protein YbbC (DUF1343 family)
LAIEYDGKQHFSSIDFFGGEEKLRITQEHDRIKNELISQHPDTIKSFIRFSYMDNLTEESVRVRLRNEHIIE